MMSPTPVTNVRKIRAAATLSQITASVPSGCCARRLLQKTSRRVLTNRTVAVSGCRLSPPIHRASVPTLRPCVGCTGLTRTSDLLVMSQASFHLLHGASCVRAPPRFTPFSPTSVERVSVFLTTSLLTCCARRLVLLSIPRSSSVEPFGIGHAVRPAIFRSTEETPDRHFSARRGIVLCGK